MTSTPSSVRSWRLQLVLVLALPSAGCGSSGIRSEARVTGAKEVGPAPASQPGTVYVTDFEMETMAGSGSGQSQGLLEHRPKPVEGVLQRLRHEPGSAEERAEELRTLLSTSLVTDLRKAGVPAYHLVAGDARPRQGWILRGVVTCLDEGNRLRRAVVGFGAGATELDVYVALVDLERDGDKPFYTIDASADSGKMPGAVIVMNPMVAGAKFVMTRNASKRDVEHTAGKIAEEIIKRVQAVPAH